MCVLCTGDASQRQLAGLKNQLQELYDEAEATIAILQHFLDAQVYTDCTHCMLIRRQINALESFSYATSNRILISDMNEDLRN